MGTYRFILAIFVLLSHTGLRILGYQPGVISVISFFLISGFTMEALMEKYYGNIHLIKYFYIDRILRLYPQFIFYLTITLLLSYFFPIGNDTSAYNGINIYISNINVIDVLRNILILPLNQYMFNGLFCCQIVPPAWSLGLELKFYIVFPLIYLMNAKKFSKYINVKVCFSFFSIIIFVMAYTGLINTDWYGYRLLPGVLFIFLIGSIIKKNESNKEKIFVFCMWLISCALFIHFNMNPQYDISNNKNVLVGILIGIPILIYLRDKKMSKSKLDSLLGNLSYGIYLNHFFVMYLIKEMPKTTIGRIELVIISTTLAFISYKIIEEPLMKVRKAFRAKVINKYNNENSKYQSALK